MISIEKKSKELTIYDLSLYSYCPRLYKYYYKNNLEPETFFSSAELLIEKICTWIYTYLLASEKPPSYNQLDSLWAQNLPKNLNETYVKHALIQFRYIMTNELFTYLPAYTNYPVRHITNNIILNSHVPVITEHEGKLSAIFFKAFPSTHYQNDLHIRFAAQKLAEISDLECILIYNLNLNKTVPSMHRLYINDLNSKMLYNDIEGMMTACVKGPYSPIFRCQRRSCIHWDDCIIGSSP